MKTATPCALVAAMLLAAGASARADDAARIAAIYPDVERLYQDLHRNPEIAFEEKRTAATLAKRLEALGYDVTTGVGGTGIVAIMKNGEGPVVMLRTELDALPMLEKTGLPFASTATTKNDAGETVPVSHMCGHDIHMAAFAGTAELMARDRERWHGTLMLVGQPAEEIVAGRHLTTWEISGNATHGLAERLRGLPGVDMVASFGATLHVSGADAPVLQASLDALRGQGSLVIKPVPPSLEDAFIHLMQNTRDPFGN